MQDTDFIEKFFSDLGDISQVEVLLNKLYFTSLLKSYRKREDIELKMYHPQNEPESICVPFALIPASKRESVTKYESLENNKSQISSYHFVACKMHAGLGTSVKRDEHLRANIKRTELGSKGTDLFVEVDGQNLSLAELQLKQLNIIKDQKTLKSVSLLNLVNQETSDIIEKLYAKNSDSISSLMQYKVPTLNSSGDLTSIRKAPAGHGYLGFYLLWNIFKNPVEKKLISIGNGEDLNSTADQRVLNWIVDEGIPMTMVTTTKLECDKKGGQIARCHENGKTYYTIVEKAQAEKAGQLDYFLNLGLREGDEEALFNTNIVILNVEAIKLALLAAPNLTETKLFEALTPTVIKNVKEQEGEEFTQLEGALGSVILNLDKYFRLELGKPLVHFLNLNKVEREEFFIPIKKMQDFEEILTRYNYSEKTGRFIKREL